MTMSGIIANGKTRLLQLFPLFVTLLAAFAIAAGSRARSEDQTTPAASDCSIVCGAVAPSEN